MMKINEKTIKFFESISLNFIDFNFDLNIEKIEKEKDSNCWNFIFYKKKFWNIEEFIKFISALQKIKNYIYKMSFSYEISPKNYDIENFISDYFFYKFKKEVKVNVDDNFIKIFIEKETEKRIIIDDLNDLVDFISLKQKCEIIFEKTNDENEQNKIADEYLKQYEEELKKKYNKHDDFFKIEEDEYVEITGEIYEALIINIKEKKILKGGLGNYKSAVAFNMVLKTEEEEKNASIIIKNFQNKEGRIFTRVTILGCFKRRGKDEKLSIDVEKIVILKRFDREDTSEKKRVELHLHTNMSQSDGVEHINSYIELAKTMGHKAIAITDHGVVQSFPFAQKAAKNDIKVLYGCEFYVVNKNFNFIFNPSDCDLYDNTYVCLDLETTGLSSEYDKIIEFGAVKIKNGLVIDRIDILINPEVELKDYISNLTHIKNSDLVNKEKFENVWPKIKKFIGDSILVTHNAIFDISFLNSELSKIGEEKITNPVIDTLSLSRYFFSDAKLHNLEALSNRLKLNIYNIDKAHRADFDAEVLGQVWYILLKEKIFQDSKIKKHSDLSSLPVSDMMIKNAPTYHVIVLAKNKQGLKDLFFLVSTSHLKYASDIPKITFEEIQKYRENFLISSACYNGEIFNAAYLYNEEVLKKKMEFYDYIEIQPLSCYKPLLTRCKFSKADENGKRKSIPSPVVESEEDIKKILLKIIKVAEKSNKMVCATGDVHYANLEEKIFREVYIATDGIGHRPHPLCTNPRGVIENHVYKTSGDQFFRSTNEMLEEFSFLDKKKAEEIVIDNPNKISDMCEVIYPIKDRLYAPNMPNADENLRKLAREEAKKYSYDEKIHERLEMELSRIIGTENSYAVNFLLAREIVLQANKDGYFVGSRGSVGSSLIANLLGITEVNPLKPHYYCDNCHKIEWYEKNDYISGIDLPEKKCVCGNLMLHNGQNIPFETFLGINEKNTKVPDIDLNFASSYQINAHNFLKKKFGSNHVFRAGTINTYKDKMAFSCVKDYFIRSEHKNFDNDVKEDYKNYLSSRCVGVKKTTGQHPGGIILIPKEYSVYDFTPIQYPADDDTSDWEITHFEFSTIHDTVLKIDLLGHVDPMALKMMGELSGVDFTKIPLNDKKVISLFTSNNELNLKNNILNIQTGTMGLPEFGTDFVQEVLKVAKPKSFNDLVIISGITHGTDVWKKNAETLLKNKTATLSEIIGCRDDIMNFLIKKGISNEISFNIMEDVRKGKGLKKEYIDIMQKYDVPSYYIESCNKIKYLFPRAHAVAYVTQAVRVGYFKVYYPLVFYAVYFSTRSEQYDIDSMLNGEEMIKKKLDELTKKRKENKISAKEISIMDTLKIACEMYERGFKFSNIDVNKSLAREFLIDDDTLTLTPPFIVVESLGDIIADNIVEERKKRIFDSISDFEKRTKVIKKHIQKLKELKAFDNVKKKCDEAKQLSLF